MKGKTKKNLQKKAKKSFELKGKRFYLCPPELRGSVDNEKQMWL